MLFYLISCNDFRSVEANECVWPWSRRTSAVHFTHTLPFSIIGSSSQKSRFLVWIYWQQQGLFVFLWFLNLQYKKTDIILAIKSREKSWCARLNQMCSHGNGHGRVQFNLQTVKYALWLNHNTVFISSRPCPVCAQINSRNCTWPCELSDDV